MANEARGQANVTLYVNGKPIGKAQALESDTRLWSTDTCLDTIGAPLEWVSNVPEPKDYSEVINVTADGIDTGLVLRSTPDGELPYEDLMKLIKRLEDMEKEGVFKEE